MTNSFESEVLPHTKNIESKLLQIFFVFVYFLCFIVRVGIFFSFCSILSCSKVYCCIFILFVYLTLFAHLLYNNIQSAHCRAFILMSLISCWLKFSFGKFSFWSFTHRCSFEKKKKSPPFMLPPSFTLFYSRESRCFFFLFFFLSSF